MTCPECQRLAEVYSDLVKENIELLTEYHAALQSRNVAKLNQLRDPLAGLEIFRKQGREQLEAHKATHATDRSNRAGA